MAEEADRDEGVAPAAEQVHLPDPSYLPVTLALGVTLIVVGIVLAPIVISTLGVIIVVVSLVRWIRSAREEMAELPLEH